MLGVTAIGDDDAMREGAIASDELNSYFEQVVADKRKDPSQDLIVDHCDDMPAAYMMADVVVSASTDPEAFGRILVEAQALGRPVVASDHGGARETVLEGETGWLFPPGDVDALASMLDKVLRLPGETRREPFGTARRVALGLRAGVAPAVGVEARTPPVPRVARSNRGTADRRCAPGVSVLPALRFAPVAIWEVPPEGTARRPESIVGAVALGAWRGIREAGRRARSVPDTSAFEP